VNQIGPIISRSPPVWRELQNRAQNERDPIKLEKVVAEMNQFLGVCEKTAQELRIRKLPR